LIIKRYPNRKLYDTCAKRYITLDGIAELIRRGEEVQVIDNATGEDLTALTLTQIILEQEKKRSGFLPRSVLAGLIQSSGDRITALQRAVLSPLNFWNQIDEEIIKRVNAIIKNGELTEEEGSILIENLLAHGEKDREKQRIKFEELRTNAGELEKQLIKRYVPTHADLEQLSNKLEELSIKLDRISQTKSMDE
jgi:polyhydroxyalkanoate synthesis repressor PhaR